MNVIPCLAWVKRGVSEALPHKITLDKEELKRLIEATKDDLEELEEDEDDVTEEVSDMEEGATAASQMEENSSGKRKKKKSKKKKSEEVEEMDEDVDDEDIVAKYGLDDYDAEEGEDEDLISGIGGLSFYASNEEDPYITVGKEEDSDEEDFEIKPTDNLVLAGRVYQDHCFLVVYVYNENLSHLYVHHDYLLPSFPLAIEWLSFDPSDASQGNLAAVATMEPVIEIWNLDVVDCVEPATVLGKKKSKKKKKKMAQGGGHADSVLDLSWNSLAGNVLASGSADQTIALWDLQQRTVATSIRQHTDKVQCVKWHPFEAQTLLSGGFDKNLYVYDCRQPHESHKKWSVEGEVERVLWNRFSPVNFFATTDSGHVQYFDIRQDTQPVFTLSAHSQAVTGISMSAAVPGLLVTTSSDKVMKVWDVESNKPSLVFEKNLKMNELYCVESCPDAPCVFAFGGQKDLKVWDIRESAKVRKHFFNRMGQQLQKECENDMGDVTEELAVLAEPDEVETEKEVLQEMAQTAGKQKKKNHKKKKKGIMDY